MLKSAFRVVCALIATGAAAQQPSPGAQRTEVVLLGTGTPVPDPRASGPATAVVIGSRLFLFDAGAGIERQLSKAGLSNSDAEAVFFTHLHSDHTLGFPDLIFTSWVFGRREPLKAYGPRGLRNMTEHLLAAYSDDIEARTKGPEGSIPNGYRVHPVEIGAGVVYDSAGVRIRAIPVPHIPGKSAFAYRIDTPDRSILISGDTGPSDNLIPWARDVDVLIHEVVNMEGISGKFPGGADVRAYMSTTHTPAEKLGQLAARAQPRLLILTHIIPTGTDERRLLELIKAGGFLGKTVFGHDLDRF